VILSATAISAVRWTTTILTIGLQMDTYRVRGVLKNLDSRDRWKSALHEAILSPTRRLFPDATTPTEPLTGV